jgi:hypothetical protein
LNLKDKSLRWDWQNPENNSFKSFEEFLAATNWTLEDVSKYKLSDAVIIGHSPQGRFLVDRKTGTYRLFSSTHERDQVLKNEYGLDAKVDLHPPGFWMVMKSRFGWQWFLAYYVGCLIWIPMSTIRAAWRSGGNQAKNIEPEASPQNKG